MLKELVEYLVDKATVKELEIGNCTYTSKKVELVQDPLPSPLGFNTLSGFVDFVKLQDAKEFLIHVKGHDEVYLRTTGTDLTNQRATLAKASIEKHGAPFKFGEHMDAETFIIGVQSRFVENDHRANLLAAIGNISAESGVQVEDDGVSQKVAMRTGVVMKSSAVLPKKLVLAPFRTFREIEQPSSEFLFRVRAQREGSPPWPALFEADGGTWMLQAIQGIAKYMKEQCPGFVVLA